jgi:hypothetical protein
MFAAELRAAAPPVEVPPNFMTNLLILIAPR